MTTVEDKYYYKYLKYKKKYLELSELYGGEHRIKKKAIAVGKGVKVQHKKSNSLTLKKIATVVGKDVEYIKILNHIKPSKKKKDPKMVIFIVAHGTAYLKTTPKVPEGITIIKSLLETTMSDGPPILNILDMVREHMEDKTVHYDISEAYAKIQRDESDFKGEIVREGNFYIDIMLDLRKSSVFNKYGLTFVFVEQYQGVVKDMKGVVSQILVDGTQVLFEGYPIEYDEKNPILEDGTPAIYQNTPGGRILIEPYMLKYIKFNQVIKMIKYGWKSKNPDGTSNFVNNQHTLSTIVDLLLSHEFSDFILMVQACSVIPEEIEEMGITEKMKDVLKKLPSIYEKIRKNLLSERNYECLNKKCDDQYKKHVSMLLSKNARNKYLKYKRKYLQLYDELYGSGSGRDQKIKKAKESLERKLQKKVKNNKPKTKEDTIKSIISYNPYMNENIISIKKHDIHSNNVLQLNQRTPKYAGELFRRVRHMGDTFKKRIITLKDLQIQGYDSDYTRLLNYNPINHRYIIIIECHGSVYIEKKDEEEKQELHDVPDRMSLIKALPNYVMNVNITHVEILDAIKNLIQDKLDKKDDMNLTDDDLLDMFYELNRTSTARHNIIHKGRVIKETQHILPFIGTKYVRPDKYTDVRLSLTDPYNQSGRCFTFIILDQQTKEAHNITRTKNPNGSAQEFTIEVDHILSELEAILSDKHSIRLSEILTFISSSAFNDATVLNNSCSAFDDHISKVNFPWLYNELRDHIRTHLPKSVSYTYPEIMRILINRDIRRIANGNGFY